ncbi:MAG: oxygen-independent coproporphyrinogen III oxidase [Chlamydiia bacterium]
MEWLSEGDLEALAALDLPVPRYTSYPPAPSWQATPSIDEVMEPFRNELETYSKAPFACYLHIPFCRSMCLFCGCSVVLNRREDRAETYVDRVLREAELYVQSFGFRPRLSQIHLGGGTPTSLSLDQMERLIRGLQSHFDWSAMQEQAIEIDPRTIEEEGAAKLRHLRDLGFNRVSFGVQDSNERVQEVIRRRQSWACSLRTLELSRSLGLDQINVDLIYGLPYQTVESFSQTARDVAGARPSRIALFSYAHVPWVKAHQKALPEHAMPMGKEKLQLYRAARQILLQAGYVSIGMDHFALPEDELVKAFHEGTLIRNFQGYSIRYSDHLIPLGMSAIGQLGSWYVQNSKELEGYQKNLEEGTLRYVRGHRKSAEDQMRSQLIEAIMCRFAVDLAHFAPDDWQERFGSELEALESWSADGWVERFGSQVRVTERGRFVVRHIARLFDVMSQEGAGIFSRGL